MRKRDKSLVMDKEQAVSNERISAQSKNTLKFESLIPFPASKKIGFFNSASLLRLKTPYNIAILKPFKRRFSYKQISKKYGRSYYLPRKGGRDTDTTF